jgi:hypothetical protein
MDQYLKELWAKAVAKLKEVWEKNKLLILIIIPLLLLAKFRDVIIDILVSSSKKLVDKTEKKDVALKKEQDRANDEANRIIAEADRKSENKPEVDEDWHKK